MHQLLRRVRDAVAWHFPFFGASRFVAGTTADEAIREAYKLTRDGFKITFNILGEHVTNNATANKYTQEYVELARRAAAEKLPATISIKLSQIGLCIYEDYCWGNLVRIIDACKTFNVPLEIDREEPRWRDATLRMFLRAHNLWQGQVRLCVQAKYDDSLQEAITHIVRDHPIRLCKGASYVSNGAGNELVADRIRRFLGFCSGLDAGWKGSLVHFSTPGHKVNVALATHDLRLVEEFIKSNPPDIWFELQVLRGMQNGFKPAVRAGYPVRVYVPYGPDWFAYACRRKQQVVKLIKPGRKQIRVPHLFQNPLQEFNNFMDTVGEVYTDLLHKPDVLR